ncbi:MAG: hypothetical protein JWM46_381 [Candidatus Kaiserbacteria bacterium]|nr:hypothetical protein [Candidatus Kaiserbacteria bacterium]
MTQDLTIASPPVERWYKGAVRSVKADGHFPHGFIDQRTLEPEEGTPPYDGPPDEGIFIHQDNTDRPLRVGMKVLFRAEPDTRRERCFRAFNATETSDSRLRGMTEGGVQIGFNQEQLDDANVFVTWCIDAALAAKVRDKIVNERERTRLLLVHFRLTGDKENPVADEKRLIAELDDPMAVISFDSSGTHRLVAMVVSGGNPEDTYLAESNGKYSTTVISHFGDCLQWAGYALGTGSVDLEIPAGLFAAQPADYAFVNQFFKKKPKNECKYRWRRAFVYPLQIVRMPYIAILALIKLIIGAIAALALWGAGMSGIAFRTFLHDPYEIPIRYIWANLGESRYVTRKDGRHFIVPLVFSPMLWIAVVLAVALYNVYRGEVSFGTATINAADVRTFLIHTSVSLGFVISLGAILGYALYWAEGIKWEEKLDRLGAMINESSERSKEKKSRARAEKWARHREEQAARERIRQDAVEREVRELICTTTGPRTPDVKQLPFRPRTIRFKFIALKQRVCKNFSKA